MKFTALFLSILLAVQLTCTQALAAAVNVNPGGNSVQGQVPVNKIGSLLLAEGLAVMSGTSIEITGKDTGNKNSVSQLTGQLVKVSVSGTASRSNVTGYAAFTGGPGLMALKKGTYAESVELTDGSTVKGPVSSVTQDSVVCNGSSISMSTVSEIHCPSVYKFSMSVANGEAQKISFESTCTKASAPKEEKQPKQSSSSSSYTSEHKGARIVVSCILLAGVACAIAIPIAVACGGRRHRNGNDSQKQLQNILLVNQFFRRPPPPPPRVQSSSSSSSP